MKIDEAWITETLINHGRQAFEKPKRAFDFTNDAEANALMDNIDQYPHAFVLACAMERRMKSESVWIIPNEFKKQLGGDFKIEKLASLSLDDIKRIMTGPPPLHRYPELMSQVFHSAVQRIITEYGKDASRIWENNPSSAVVIYRFYEFWGVGPKIANLAANSLLRDYKKPLKDHCFLDVSADVHVCRVFGRLGLTKKGTTPEDVIFRARTINPEYPGLIDPPCWEIGRNWCKARELLCGSCYMHEKCPTASAQAST